LLYCFHRYHFRRKSKEYIVAGIINRCEIYSYLAGYLFNSNLYYYGRTFTVVS
jgi:hypothetical protein